MSGDDRPMFGAPEEANNRNGNGNGNDNDNEPSQWDGDNNTEATGAHLPLPGTLVELAVMAQQQHLQQQFHALMQQARNMQQANLIRQLNAQQQQQQQQLTQQGGSLPAFAMPSFPSLAVPNSSVSSSLGLSLGPQSQAHTMTAMLGYPVHNSAASLQSAAALLASAGNMQQALSQQQHQLQLRNDQANNPGDGDAAAAAVAWGLRMESPHLLAGLSNSSNYHLLGGLGLVGEANPAPPNALLGAPSSALDALGIPSPFAAVQQLPTGLPFGNNVPNWGGMAAPAPSSFSSGNTTMPTAAVVETLPNQLRTALSILHHQQQAAATAAAAAQTPPSMTSILQALNVPSSISAAAMAPYQLAATAHASSVVIPSGIITSGAAASTSLSSAGEGGGGTPVLTNRPPIPLYLDDDAHSLNAYQCLLRKQIDLFETAPTSGVEGRSQGRNTPIRIGQVGIRCRHCSSLPNKARPKGAVYYSKSLDGVYQVAQNMSKVHLTDRCRRIPDDVKQQLIALHNVNRRASGGKPYWVDGLKQLGVCEDGPILRFVQEPPPPIYDNPGSDDNDQKQPSR